MTKFQINYSVEGIDTYTPSVYIIVAKDKIHALELFNDRPKAFNNFGKIRVDSVKEVVDEPAV